MLRIGYVGYADHTNRSCAEIKCVIGPMPFYLFPITEKGWQILGKI